MARERQAGILTLAFHYIRHDQLTRQEDLNIRQGRRYYRAALEQQTTPGWRRAGRHVREGGGGGGTELRQVSEGKRGGIEPLEVCAVRGIGCPRRLRRRWRV